MTNSAPVIQPDSSLAKNRQPLAISIGRPYRFIGVLARRGAESSGSSCMDCVIGVVTKPGWTEFTRMFSVAYWSAADLVASRTEPLEA